MTKVTMPEPVAWLHVCRKKPELRELLYEKSAPELAVRGFVPEPLITTTQAEAYADARVREALEEAASVVEQHNKTGREWVPGSLWDAITQEAVGRIKALVPRNR